MEKIKAIFEYAFTVEFLLKILIITVISTLWGAGFTIRVSDISLHNGYGAFEINLKAPITIKPEIGGFEIKRPLAGSEIIENLKQGDFIPR